MQVFLSKLYENVIVCRHPAAAASFIQVSFCPVKPVLGFWTLSEQVRWIIFLCTSLLKPFFSVISYPSILSFPSLQPKGRILTYPNCNVTLKEYYFPWWWAGFRGRRQQRFTLCLGQATRWQYYRHRGTCGWRIRGSLSADSQLKFLS